MARVKIDKQVMLTYDMSLKTNYWPVLSTYIAEKHGKGKFTDHSKVEEILKDGFQFLVDEFRTTVLSENGYTFYKYVFWLHEESIRLMVKFRGGLKQNQISEEEFARYRRILKLILEQGCDIDMVWGPKLSPELVFKMDDNIQQLIYLGTWIYEFSDYIAHHRMVENYHCIRFNNDDLVIDWQFHYGEAYDALSPHFTPDYVGAVFDERALTELKQAIEDCFGINYDYAGGIIFHLKEHLNPNEPELQTIEPYVLPVNLAHESSIAKEIAETFYNGLTISRENKLSVEDAVYKPYSTLRYMFRPILVFKIEGVDRAIVGKGKFAESMYVIATNLIHWNDIFSEWMTIKCINDFVQRKKDEHDQILEDKIEEVVKKVNFPYCRNIQSFKQKSGTNLPFEKEPGEIDFIVVNLLARKIYVADSKYIRAKYEGVGFSNDYSKFLGYEKQIERKTKWISENLKALEEHLQITYENDELSIHDFQVEGVLLINTPTFYMFNGNYKAITLNQMETFFNGTYNYPVLDIVREFEGEKKSFKIHHPYFRVP
jgi:hypothetical protein